MKRLTKLGLGLLGLLAFLAACTAPTASTGSTDSTEPTEPTESAEARRGAHRTPQEGLEEGNRLFRLGRLDEARETYRSGWDPGQPDAVLAYNLGTTAHHQGRLAEAVLWYRRAARLSEADRWLVENLELAREELQAPRHEPPNLPARLRGNTVWLWLLAALAGWSSLLLGVLERGGKQGGPGRRGLAHRAAHWLGTGRAGPLALALWIAALVLVLAALAIVRWAPVQAVVLEECGASERSGDTTEEGSEPTVVGQKARALPAGSEVWGTREGDGGFQVLGPEGPIPCPGGRVEAIVDPTNHTTE